MNLKHWKENGVSYKRGETVRHVQRRTSVDRASPTVVSGPSLISCFNLSSDPRTFNRDATRSR